MTIEENDFTNLMKNEKKYDEIKKYDGIKKNIPQVK